MWWTHNFDDPRRDPYPAITDANGAIHCQVVRCNVHNGEVEVLDFSGETRRYVTRPPLHVTED